MSAPTIDWARVLVIPTRCGASSRMDVPTQRLRTAGGTRRQQGVGGQGEGSMGRQQELEGAEAGASTGSASSKDFRIYGPRQNHRQPRKSCI